jgi:hypothetical protein
VRAASQPVNGRLIWGRLIRAGPRRACDADAHGVAVATGGSGTGADAELECFLFLQRRPINTRSRSEVRAACMPCLPHRPPSIIKLGFAGLSEGRLLRKGALAAQGKRSLAMFRVELTRALMRNAPTSHTCVASQVLSSRYQHAQQTAAAAQKKNTGPILSMRQLQEPLVK